MQHKWKKKGHFSMQHAASDYSHPRGQSSIGDEFHNRN